MIAWAIVATMLVAMFTVLAAVSPAAAEAWRTVTRAFIAAPLSLVAMTLVLSVA